MIKVIPIASRYLSLLSYILADEEAGECVVVDPAKEISGYLDRALKVTAVVNTHIHFDHTLGIAGFGKSIKAMAHELENRTFYRITNRFITSMISGMKAPKISFSLKDGDSIKLGKTNIKVIHTPGHSPGSICLYWEGNLVSGDTMFIGGVGRTDIPHGSSSTLKKSLQRLLELPGETLIWPGHAYSSKYPVTLEENRRAIVWMMNSL